VAKQPCPFCGGQIDAQPAVGLAVNDEPMVIRQRGFCADCGRAVQRVIDKPSMEANPWIDGLSEVEREFWGDDEP
jgi:hypothetical protein